MAFVTPVTPPLWPHLLEGRARELTNPTFWKRRTVVLGDSPLYGLRLSLSDSRIYLKVRNVRGLEPVVFSLTRAPPRVSIAPIQKRSGKTAVEHARKRSLRLCESSATPPAAQPIRGLGRSQRGDFPGPLSPGTHTEPAAQPTSLPRPGQPQRPGRGCCFNKKRFYWSRRFQVGPL